MLRKVIARSPRTWGWTGSAPQTYTDRDAFPTHVGMDRSTAPHRDTATRVPHARGDGPFFFGEFLQSY